MSSKSIKTGSTNDISINSSLDHSDMSINSDLCNGTKLNINKDNINQIQDNFNKIDD